MKRQEDEMQVAGARPSGPQIGSLAAKVQSMIEEIDHRVAVIMENLGTPREVVSPPNTVAREPDRLLLPDRLMRALSRAESAIRGLDTIAVQLGE